MNKAQAFGGSHSPSLQNFLHWLTEADAEIKRELDHGDAQSGGQVRLMTVHASKGLEAPIVFLPDTVSLPLPQHVPKLQWSKEGLPVFIARKPEFGAAGGLWQMTHKKQREEYRRLFYVALTRASHRLYLCGWLNKKTDEAPAGSWYDLASALRSEHRDFHPVEDGPKPEIIHADSTPLAPPLQDQARESTTPCAPLPVWARRRVEAVFTAPVLTSSDFAEDTSAASPDTAFARGCIIHRLLQSLPDLQLAQRAAAMERFLWQPRHWLTHGQREEIAQEVGRLMKEEAFALLFGAESRAEVPLTGRLDGAPIFRQVDRLCLRGDEVWIVDYKTNRPPPERATDIPASYRRQMNEYHLLLREIYPDKKVRCFLLWTYRPSLMEVEL